jgi:hypothetical protein
LNGPDTAAHIHGPDSEEAIESYRSLDRCLAIINAALRPHWEETLLLVTSDHDQETVDLSLRIDLGELAHDRGVEVMVLNEGTAAVLVGPGSKQAAWFDDSPGVEGSLPVSDDARLVFSCPGWWFAGPLSQALRGAHGGLRTRSTVAVASGGTQAISSLSPAFGSQRLGAEEWHHLVQMARRE